MKILVFLRGLLALGYIAINFVGLPPLLVSENVALAAIYAALAIALYFKPNGLILSLPALAAVFNAGRMSRSVRSPTTGWGLFAAEHFSLGLANGGDYSTSSIDIGKK